MARTVNPKKPSLVAESGEFEWSPIEGVLIKVTPEGRILFKDIATGKITGDKPVKKGGVDIYKLGVSPKPPSITKSAGLSAFPMTPSGSEIASYNAWKSKITPAINKAIENYKNSPEGKKAQKNAEVLKKQGLQKSPVAGEYMKEGIEGVYKLRDEGNIDFSGGIDKSTGQKIAPMRASSGGDFTEEGRGRGDRKEGFRLKSPEERKRIIAESDAASGIPTGETIKPSGVKSAQDIPTRKESDMELNQISRLPAGTSLALDPSGNLVSTAPKLDLDDKGNMVSKIGGVEPPTPNKIASSIKQAVATKKGTSTSTTPTSATTTSTTSKPSGRGMSLGSGSSLDYLRSEEEVEARNKEVRDRMGKEQKSRRLDAEARFRERRDFIEQGKKIEDPNLIKDQGGRELGRVIKDRTGKIVGSSLNNLGRTALGNRQGMGVVEGGVPDSSKFEGTPTEKTLQALRAMDTRDQGIKNITDTQKDVSKMFYGGLDSKQQARVNRASQRSVPLETPKESPFEFQGDKNKAPLTGRPSVGDIPTAPNNLAGRNALNNMIKTARQKRTEGFNFDPEVENMLQKNEAKRAEEEDRMVSIVESGEPMDDRQRNEEYDKIFKKGRKIRKGL